LIGYGLKIIYKSCSSNSSKVESEGRVYLIEDLTEPRAEAISGSDFWNIFENPACCTSVVAGLVTSDFLDKTELFTSKLSDVFIYSFVSSGTEPSRDFAGDAIY
jgi:hypothetical protein